MASSDSQIDKPQCGRVSQKSWAARCKYKHRHKPKFNKTYSTVWLSNMADTFLEKRTRCTKVCEHYISWLCFLDVNWLARQTLITGLLINSEQDNISCTVLNNLWPQINLPWIKSFSVSLPYSLKLILLNHEGRKIICVNNAILNKHLSVKLDMHFHNTNTNSWNSNILLQLHG